MFAVAKTLIVTSIIKKQSPSKGTTPKSLYVLSTCKVPVLYAYADSSARSAVESGKAAYVLYIV